MRFGHTVAYQPVGKIAVKVKDADLRNASSRDLSRAANIVHQILRGECRRLIQRVAEERRLEIAFHYFHSESLRFVAHIKMGTRDTTSVIVAAVAFSC